MEPRLKTSSCMDAADVAGMLGIPEATIVRWARQGKIPFRTQGGRFVFSNQEILRWAREHNLRTAAPVEPSGTPIGQHALLQALCAGGMHADVAGSSVAEVLARAAELCPVVDDAMRPALVQQLLQRELIASTGIGNGIALPHPRHPLRDIGPCCAVTACFLRTPVDFKAIDGQPVTVLFLLVCPDTKSHLGMLSRLSFCLRSAEVLRAVKAHAGADELLGLIGRLEETIP